MRLPYLRWACFLCAGVASSLAGPAKTAAQDELARMYWGNRDKIQRAALDGTQLETIVSGGQGTATGLDIDPVDRKVYWGDLSWSRIRRANLDGTQPEDLPMSTGSTYAVRLDVARRQIYWSDRDYGFSRAALDGSGLETFTTTARVHGFDLDLSNSHIYWGSSGGVYRANLDGTGQQLLISVGNSVPRVRLDLNGGKVYWAAGASIFRADLDGRGIEPLVSGLNNGIGLDLDLAAGKLYWTDNLARQIGRADLNGGNREILVTLPQWDANPLDLRIMPVPEPTALLSAMLLLLWAGRRPVA